MRSHQLPGDAAVRFSCLRPFDPVRLFWKENTLGLTIHYGLTSKTRSTARAKALVERMRQLAFDLPFEKVDDQVRHLGPDVCQRPLDDLRPEQDLFSAVLDGCQHVDIPWHRKQSASVTVQPLEIISF